MRHTKGPWELLRNEYSTPIACDKTDKTGRRLYVAHAILDSRDLPLVEQYANARLITLAPEILEAYQRLWKATEDGAVDTDFFKLREDYREIMSKLRG